MKRYIILIFMLLPMLALFAQKESRNVNAGNKYYKKEKFVESEVEYRKGLEQNNSSFSANFNLGDALYRQEKYEDAAEQFAKAAVLAGNDSKRIAASHHNRGNALLNAQKIDEAIDAYKEALRHNPEDHDTRYNLAYAKHLRQQQQQQQHRATTFFHAWCRFQYTRRSCQTKDRQRVYRPPKRNRERYPLS